MTVREILWPVQDEAVTKIAERRKIGLFDEPGSGKTLMAMAALEDAGAFEEGVSLVLVPKDPAKLTWAPHFAMHAPNVNIINCYSGSGQQKAARIRNIIPGTIVLANHDAIGIAKTGKPTVPGLAELPYSHIVIDEAHEIIPLTTDKMTEFTQIWRGLARVRAQLPDTGIALLMTGTPDRGKLQHRYGYLKFFWPRAFRDFWAWAKENFTIEKQKIIRRIPGQGIVERYVPIIGDLLPQARPRWEGLDAVYVIRRTKDEIRAGRPKKHSIPVMIDLEPEQVKALDEYDRRVWEGDVKDTPATWAIRSRQLAGIGQWKLPPDGEPQHAVPLDGAQSGKYVWLREWLRDRGYFDPEFQINPEHPSKVVISFAFTETLEWVRRALHADGLPDLSSTPTIGAIKGGQANENLRVKNTFQDFSSTMRIVLLQQQTGRGIDLDAADDLIHFDLMYDPDLTQQVEDRIDRLSRDHRCTIWWLVGKGTIDAAIAFENQGRFESTRELLDGARGIEYQRRMLGKITKEARHAE